MKGRVTSPEPIAEWMLEQVRRYGYLDQKHAAQYIRDVFSEKCTYSNDQGHLAIQPDLLTAFEDISPDVVWERSKFRWRPRTDDDPPGIRQVR